MFGIEWSREWRRRWPSSSCWWLLVNVHCAVQCCTVPHAVVCTARHVCTVVRYAVLYAVFVHHFSLFIFNTCCHGTVFVVVFKETDFNSWTRAHVQLRWLHSVKSNSDKMVVGQFSGKYQREPRSHVRESLCNMKTGIFELHVCRRHCRSGFS